jgi:three-Cys-motif partner protein
MSNPSEVARQFYIDPDDESRAKSRFVYYYIGLYLKIINNIRERKPFAKYRRIVYLDLFAGEGKYGTGDESVPLKVLESAKDIGNIRFYFNDLYRSSALEENIKKKFNYDSLPANITVNSDDATKVNISSLFTKNDIVISYVDSFSCLLCDTGTIDFLIRNDLSDCIFYLNLDFFFRWINTDQEEQTMERFFGSKDVLMHFRERCNEGISRDQVTKEIIQDFTNRLNLEHGQKLFYLPVFFKKGQEETFISQVILVVSKSDTGLVAVKERFTEVPKKEENIGGKIERDFYLVDGSITVYTDYSRDQMSLLNDEETDKFLSLLPYIPTEKTWAINCPELLHKIDLSFSRRFGFISGYTAKFLREALTYFEENGMIRTSYNGQRQRPKGTWGSNTVFWKAEGKL